MAKFGFSLRRFQDIESGKSNLTLTTLHKLAQALDVSVTFLTQVIGCQELCHMKEGQYNQVFKAMPFGLIVWELVNPADRQSLSLVDCNTLGEQLTLPGLSQNVGKRLVDLFPKTLAMGYVDIFFRVIQTGIEQTLPNYFYEDENLGPSHYTLWCVPLCHSRVGVMFKRETRA